MIRNNIRKFRHAPRYMAGAVLLSALLYTAFLALPSSLAAGSLADENIAASGDGWTIAGRSATVSVSSSSSCGSVSAKDSSPLVLKNSSGEGATLSFQYTISNGGSFTFTPPDGVPFDDTGTFYSVTLPADGELQIVAKSNSANTDACEAALSDISLGYGSAEIIFYSGEHGSITITDPENQSLTLGQSYSYSVGTRFSLVAVPEKEYKFAYWQIN